MWLVGVRKISAYGFNFLCSTSVFKHKGKVPGIDEWRVSEVSDPPLWGLSVMPMT